MQAPQAVVLQLTAVLSERVTTPVTVASLGDVVKLAMELVETQAAGYDKRGLVVDIVKAVLATDGGDTLVDDLANNGALGSMVDVIVSASRGLVDINSAARVGKATCLTACKRVCLGYLRKRLSRL